MNNKNLLTDKLGEIDSKFLDEYYDRLSRRALKRKSIMKYCSIAASVMIVVTISIATMLPMFRKAPAGNPVDTSIGVIDNTDSNNENADGNKDNNKPDNSNYTEIKPVDDPELSYEIQQNNDYNIPTDLLPMIDAVDLVIVGTYDGTVSTYATETGQIYSIGRVSDFYVLKGEASLEPKEITFHGGALPVSEFMKYARPDISASRGFDKLSKLEADTKYVGVPVTQYSANPIKGAIYMFLLSCDESTGEYFVACDGYGVREISTDGTGVWNPDTEEFEPYFAVYENNYNK